MVQFAGVGNRISLKKLCMALGIPDDDEFDGSMVAELVASGRLDDVVKHCTFDIVKTQAVFKRMMFIA